MGSSTMIILDTHVLLWLAAGDESLGQRAIQTIDAANHDNQLALSAISFWEIALLQKKGRIALKEDIPTWRIGWLKRGLQEIPMNGDIVIHSTALTSFHPDPADRFIVSTAILSQGQLLTADGKILNWSGKLERLNARQ